MVDQPRGENAAVVRKVVLDALQMRFPAAEMAEDAADAVLDALDVRLICRHCAKAPHPLLADHGFRPMFGIYGVCPPDDAGAVASDPIAEALDAQRARGGHLSDDDSARTARTNAEPAD